MDIEEVFNFIQSKTMANRLKRELNVIKNEYDVLFIDYSDKGELKIYFQKKEKEYSFCSIYCFTFPDCYPFRPPIITINDISYFNTLRLKSERFNSTLKYITGLHCLCCSSFLCRDHWSPAFTVKKILSEIDDFKKIKRNIIRKLLLDKIKEKYLINDIDLDSWLFPLNSKYLIKR
jgi:ubiquitin-protein ligase